METRQESAESSSQRKTASDVFVLPGVLDEAQKAIEEAAGLASNGIPLHRKEEAADQAKSILRQLESYRSRGDSEVNLRVENLIMAARSAVSKLAASISNKG